MTPNLIDRDFGFANLALAVVWGLTVVGGIVVMLDYQNRSVSGEPQPDYWPDSSSLTRSVERPTVVMFLHPHCPCSRASVSEWHRLVAVSRQQADFQIVVFDTVRGGWRDSDLVRSLGDEVEIHWDCEGHIARKFEIVTSGHVVAYDVSGRLRFSGGITGARGHEGNNRGRQQLTQLLDRPVVSGELAAEIYRSPVFGCALFDATGGSQSQ